MTVSDDASWLTALKDGNTIIVSYEANPSTSPRTANTTATGEGLSESVSSESGSVSINVSCNVEWNVSSSDSWLLATKTDASTLTIDYEENTSENERSATITLSGGGLSHSVTCVQDGTSTTAVDNNIEDQTITIYPNPVSDRLYIKAESEIGEDIRIVLFDILGNQIHSQTISQPHKGEIFSIDLSIFKSGTYFLRVNNSKTYKFQKL